MNPPPKPDPAPTPDPPDPQPNPNPDPIPGVPDPTPDDEGNVGKLSIMPSKFPTFWRAKPRIWFAQIEALFRSAKITSEKTKFNQTVCQLDTEVLGALEDLFELPEEQQTYSALKVRLLAHFSESETKRLQVLLQELALEDKKPSTLLREMRSLAGNGISEDFLRNMWIQRLPRQTQAILSVHTGPLAELAQQADRIAEVSPSSSVAAVTAPVETSAQPDWVSVTNAIREMTKAIADLKRGNSNFTRSRSHSRSNEARQDMTSRKSPARTVEKSVKCYYHRVYGDRANKCRSPCAHKPEN